MDPKSFSLTCNHDLFLFLPGLNRLAKIPPTPHPAKYAYCIYRQWFFVGLLWVLCGAFKGYFSAILLLSMSGLPPSFPPIPIKLHNPCVHKIGGRSYLASTDWRPPPPTLPGIRTVSIDSGFLWVFCGYFAGRLKGTFPPSLRLIPIILHNSCVQKNGACSRRVLDWRQACVTICYEVRQKLSEVDDAFSALDHRN